MGKVIQFPVRTPPEPPVELGFEPPPPETCTEHIHVFDQVPGRCRCGENTWESVPETDIGIHEVK